MSVDYFVDNLIWKIKQQCVYLRERGRSYESITSTLETYYKNYPCNYIQDVIIELEGEDTLIVMMDVVNSPLF